MPQATGTFDVKVAPMPPEAGTEAPTLGRMSLDKQFHGDLKANGKCQMLTSGSPGGSGAYVAIERVTGSVHGRSGSFVLHHTGLMTRGQPHLTIAVVPDSGAGELVGLCGNLSIQIADGKHFYTVDYTRQETPDS